MSDIDIDGIDRQILALLAENARRPVSDIAARVGLSPSPVTRRIDRLERLGVIVGYTTVTDPVLLGETIEAFAELRFSGRTAVDKITGSARSIPEVMAVYTIAGDPDALVHFRVENLRHLQLLVDRLRQDPNIIGTKSLIVLGSWRRNSRESRGAD